MTTIVPHTELYLIKCPLAIDNANQLTFDSEEEQQEYFLSLEKLYVDDFTYQRKDYSIRYPGLIDDLIEYNYCMYKNNNYSNKWFYAYITNIQYVNDNMSLISIKSDVFQSWQFDLTYKQSFVVREHSDYSDFPYSNLEPEDFELGEYVINDVQEYTLNHNGYWFCMASTVELSSPYSNNGGATYGGIYQGYRIYGFQDLQYLRTAVKNLDNAGKSDAILGIFMFPKDLCSIAASYTGYYELGGNIVIKYFNLQEPESLNGYVPRNKKLLNYPFRYCALDNNGGSQHILHYEKGFTQPFGLNIKLCGFPSLTSSWIMIPQSYNNYHNREVSPGENLQESVTGCKFPQCGWQSDIYTNWLTQQAKNLNIAEASAGLSYQKASLENELNLIKAENKTKNAPLNMGANLLGSIFQAVATGNVLAPFASFNNGLADVENASADETYLNRNKDNLKIGYDIELASIQAKKYEHSLIPGSAKGNINASDIIFGLDNYNPKAYHYSIRYEFAEKIDKYFDMFGYATNKMKLPNLNNKTNWNYIKTARINIIGNIPQIDLQEIKNMFDNGITLWHNPTTFLDYSQSNEQVIGG